ncbi:hypothetical protein SAMN00790413_03710 [Deinococcus hopiensis KR-140]|uniref:Uncharacterized protein n=2 Tax=Deinococcus TaxID=1298 RepID=A0A1W1UYI6_9DEIO|nr:hypothetical protein SAMN00790413_03710 [Deinococcus hopiensis KR-140]
MAFPEFKGPAGSRPELSKLEVNLCVSAHCKDAAERRRLFSEPTLALTSLHGQYQQALTHEREVSDGGSAPIRNLEEAVRMLNIALTRLPTLAQE